MYAPKKKHLYVLFRQVCVSCDTVTKVSTYGKAEDQNYTCASVTSMN
jgi:hypothetical protein